MGFLEQLRTLDLLYHDAGARRRFASAPALFLEFLPPGDRAPFFALDVPRLEVVARDLAAKIHSRWYLERFPLSLRALALLTTASREQRDAPAVEPGAAVVETVMAHEAFGRRVGEDTTGVGFFTALLHEAQSPHLQARAFWLPGLLAYEYIVRCGLPRRALGEAIDAGLEAALLGENVREFTPPGPLPSPGQVSLATPAYVAHFDAPVSAIAEHLDTADELPDQVAPIPTRVIFFLGCERIDELTDEYPLHELVLAAAAGNLRRDELAAALPEADPDQVEAALDHLLAEGFLLAGSL